MPMFRTYLAQQLRSRDVLWHICTVSRGSGPVEVETIRVFTEAEAYEIIKGIP